MAMDSSASAQKRRVTKPLIEKRRRARINSSLAQLKDMVAKPNPNVQENRSNRLEKADILEMTVEYVKRIHCNKNATERLSSYKSINADSDHSFQEGYRLCMSEVQNFFYKNHQKQASKDFLNLSLQSYLQQKFKGNFVSGRNSPNSIPFDVINSPKKNTPKKCICKNEKAASDAKDFPSNIEENYEFHSEGSNFGSSYSSTSTDDEMPESLCQSKIKVRNVLNEQFLLNEAISQRYPAHRNNNEHLNTTENMWRPW